MRAFLSVLFAVFLLATPAFSVAAERPATDRTVYDWGVAYYMSYNNNLERLGLPIINQIRAGGAGKNTVVTLQAAFNEPGKMRRYTMKSDSFEEVVINSDDSANEEQVYSFLEWFVKNYPCRRYIVVFLDHGGKLDQMSYNERPPKGGKNWMSGNLLGEKLRQLKSTMNGTFELLFLQQCGRGSLENLYSFRETGQYVMSSPVNVGAPNTYYAALHRRLAADSNLSGKDIAKIIAEEDLDYSLYTCIATKKLNELPLKINGLLAPLLEKDQLRGPDRLRHIYRFDDERTFDAKEYFSALYRSNGMDMMPVTSFFDWVDGELMVFKRANESAGARFAKYSGLALLVPASDSERTIYTNMGLFKNSNLGKLWGKMVAVPAVSKP